jgi:nucleoside-diphosphate-sugar epimerase
VQSRQDERVLVSGSAGVIARELLQSLGKQGGRVLSVDRLPLPEAAPPNVEHRQADLAIDDLGFISDFRPTRVFHLAASFERAQETPEFWAPNWLDNVVASHRTLEAVRAGGSLRVFVFASSYLLYSSSLYLNRQLPPEPRFLTEDDRLEPRNLCGFAKLYAEGELSFAREVIGDEFRLVCARIFRVYGRGSRDVLSRWVRMALRDEELAVYRPENTLDYIYAGDVAEGLIRLAECENARGVVNLGTGRPTSITHALDAIKTAIASVRSVTVASDEPFETSCADVSRLERLTGWRPPTSIEEGVSRLVAHEQSAR